MSLLLKRLYFRLWPQVGLSTKHLQVATRLFLTFELPTSNFASIAPTGHTYFYNPTTKKSTYTRPVAVAPIPTPTPATFSQAQQQQFPFAAAAGAFPGYGAPRQQQFPAFNAGFPQHHMGYGGSRGGRPGGRGGFGQNRPQGPYQKRHEKPDRPKKKYAFYLQSGV